MENREQKLPLPPFTLETVCKRCNWQKMHGIVKILNEFQKHTPQIPSGETETEFINGREEVVSFLKRRWQKELQLQTFKKSCGIS